MSFQRSLVRDGHLKFAPVVQGALRAALSAQVPEVELSDLIDLIVAHAITKEDLSVNRERMAGLMRVVLIQDVPIQVVLMQAVLI